MHPSITQLHNDIQSGALTIDALVASCKKTIEEHEKDVHALLGFYDEAFILDQIQKAKAMFANNTATLLTGIPIVLKDNIVVSGQRATAGSKILEEYVAPYDATVVKKLKASGAILLARANMDEFAMGGSTENSAYGVTKNPHDLTRVAGGSSGGSSAVVAYGGVPISLGSDTGGSIRQPASFCGVVGLKPTYGRVSRYGLMAMGSSLDQIGPFAHSVTDAEIVYNVIQGKDPLDGTSIDAPHVSSSPLKKVLGVPMGFIDRKGIDAEVLEDFKNSIKRLTSFGYTTKEIHMEHLEKALSVYYIVMFAEVSSNLARYDGVRYGLSHPGETSIRGYFESRTKGFGKEVRRRILIGTYVLSSGYYDAYYNKANIVRELLREEFAQVFKDVDAVVMPNAPTPAFTIGEKSDPLAMYLEDIFTVPVNIVGVPAIAIPSGKTKSGLPLGLQIIAPHTREDVLFAIGKDFERSA
jgi:aspartyl-tRNA(Asn)/glutamyl-tRNA(Gln) amidotransferase subunit A